MTYANKSHRGFTLMELMFTITVLGVLLALAVPSFRETIENNRVTAQNNEFVTALNYARSEALRRVGSVTVCASANGATCSGAGVTNWSTGWIAFADRNSDGALNGAEEVMQIWPATSDGFTLNATTRNFVRYGSNGVASGAETFVLTKPLCTGKKTRRITIGVTGRVTTEAIACS
jgi:type IV fimbrial biogenesis protein FimT